MHTFYDMKKSPEEARRILGRVPDPVSFWLCTNRKLFSLKELSFSLEEVSDETFRYHVNRDKNDFENWIRDIIQDTELPNKISIIKTKETLTRKIQERVDELSMTILLSKPKKKPAKKAKKHSKKVKKKKKR